jgi:hypothetical protein
MARRITPVAVDQPDGGQGLPVHSLAFEGPLDVGPAPDQGDVRAVHPELGAGRRVWVDIQSNWQVKFKQVRCLAPQSYPSCCTAEGTSKHGSDSMRKLAGRAGH